MKANHLAQTVQNNFHLPTSGDRVLCFIIKGNQQIIYRHSCKDFLARYPNWQELMNQGLALYMCKEGKPLEAEQGILRLLSQTETINPKPSKAGADLFSASSQNKARVQTLREQISQRVRQNRSA